MTAVLVFLGAAVGAPLRYLPDRAVQARHDSLFPWGTFIVNLVGCLVLGALPGARPGRYRVLRGVDHYSTFSYETVRLVEQKAYFYAAMNAIVSVIAGLGAARLAYTTIAAVGHRLTPRWSYL